MTMRYALLGLAIANLFSPRATADDARIVSFRQEIAPILVKYCLGCHNDTKAEVGLNMATFTKLKRGGKESGANILIPGKPDDSRLIEVIRADAEPRMPLKAKPLDDTTIKVLETWVAQGAKFDGASEESSTLASLVDPLIGLPKVAHRPGTSDPIGALAFAPDGKTLAAAVGKNVLIYDAETGKELAAFADNPGQVTFVAFTPDGKTIVVAGGRPGQFGAIATWDLATKTRRLEARGQTDAILGADLSADGKTLATASYDRTIFVWDVATGTIITGLVEHTDAVHSIAFSRDAKRLVSAAADRTVKYWDLETGRRLATLSDATAELYAVQFGVDDTRVIAAGVDRIIRLWNPQENGGRLLHSAFAHEGPIIRLVLSADRKTLVSSGEDKKIKLWDASTLAPKMTLSTQPDWAHALAFRPDGQQLAVGRYDGSIAILDLADDSKSRTIRQVKEEPKQPVKPPLIRGATLNVPSPRGVVRGSKVRLNLTGNGVGNSIAVLFEDPSLVATIVPSTKPDANRLEVDLTIPDDTRPGLHRLSVQTPFGIPPSQPLAISAYPEVNEVDPKAAEPMSVAMPSTLVGVLSAAGEIDRFRLEFNSNQTIVMESVSKSIGSPIDTHLQIMDQEGRVLADSAGKSEASADPILSFTPAVSGRYTLVVSDLQAGGSAGHLYRIHVGELPAVKSSFPLGVSPGQTSSITLKGQNLSDSSHICFRSDAPIGSIVAVSMPKLTQPLAGPSPRVIVAEGPQASEQEDANSLAIAGDVASPGGFSGTLDHPGAADYVRFLAKKDEPLALSVFGRRLGSPIDATLEILDDQGRAVPQTVLQRITETAVAFRDHDATKPGIRLTQWTELAMDDYVLMGREVMRVFALPRGPDDDCLFYQFGGRRIGYFGTTPEHHPVSQPVYKVEIHPPGTSLSGGSLDPIVLAYRNDDAFGSDPQLTFKPPADGTYFARIEESRGRGGPDFGYHLVVRQPRPGVIVSLPENLNVPRGGTMIFTATATRIDGFDGPVEVSLKDLPPGVRATSATIESGQSTAELLLMAETDAPAFSAATWRAEAKSIVHGSVVTQSIDPGGPGRGWITVTPEPDLKLRARPEVVTILPGKEVELTLIVERSPGFVGRVPIDIRNLPHGVRIQNIGLNGVLVTEQQQERSVTIYAETWVKPSVRSIYAVGKVEAAGSEQSSPPITLNVQPSSSTTALIP